MTFIELCEDELKRITNDMVQSTPINLIDRGHNCLNTIGDYIRDFLKENASRIEDLYNDTKDNEDLYCELRNVEFARTKYFEYVQNIRDIISKGMYDKIADVSLDAFIDRDEKFIKALYSDDENPSASLTVKDGFDELNHLPELIQDISEFRDLITYTKEDAHATTDFMTRLSCISTARYTVRTFKELSEILNIMDSTVNPKEPVERNHVERYKVFKPEDFELGEND